MNHPMGGLSGHAGLCTEPFRGRHADSTLLPFSGVQATSTHGHSLNIWRTATAAGLPAPQQTSLIWGSRDKCNGNKSTKNFTQWLGALQIIKESYWEKRWHSSCSLNDRKKPGTWRSQGAEIPGGKQPRAWEKQGCQGNKSPVVLERWPGQHVNGDSQSGLPWYRILYTLWGIWFFFSATYKKPFFLWRF